MNHRMVLVLLLAFALGLAACQRQVDGRPVIEHYSVGYSTPEGNDIWVRRVVFDNRWSRPVGNLGCCWQEARAASGVDDRPMPLTVYLEWIDESEQLLYTATVKLDPETGKKALALPYFRYEGESEDFHGIELIIGMREDGYVEVWLSNAPYKGHGNIIGRVLETVGQAQATSKPWVPPKQKPPMPPKAERAP